MNEATANLISTICLQAGFELCGFLNRREARFDDWIAGWLSQGRQGEMTWLAKNRQFRLDPCTIVNEARTIVVLGYPYHTQPPDQWEKWNPISRYAWGLDYHEVLKRKAQEILQTLQKQLPGLEGRVFVDTAPLPEKVIAAQCGLGWIGKNSLLVSQTFGSYFFLAEIVCNLDLESTPPVSDRCGQCRLCIDACPNQAILEDRTIDARRCISYLTVEKRGAFSDDEQLAVGYQLFGCDRCQEVCPWNRDLHSDPNSPFRCFERWSRLDLGQLIHLDETELARLLVGSPLKRSKGEGIRRNAEAVWKNIARIQQPENLPYQSPKSRCVKTLADSAASCRFRNALSDKV